MNWYFSENETVIRCIKETFGWTDEQRIQNIIGHFEQAVVDPTAIDEARLYATFSQWLKYCSKYSDLDQLYRVTRNNLVLSLREPSDADEVPIEQGANIIQGRFGKS